MRKKNIFNLLFFTVLLSAGFVSGCEKTPAVEEKPELPPKIAQIVTTKCAVSGCHNAFHESLNTSDWNSIMKGSTRYGAVVVPYNPEWSHFFQHVNRYSDLGFVLSADDRMPPVPFDSLSREEVTEIKNWINDGAKNEFGKYYWESQEVRSNNKAFILCSGSDLIAVVDIPSNKIMRYISVGVNPASVESPHYIVLSPDKKYFYVTLIQGTAIEKYRTDNYQFEGRVVVANNPSLMAVNQSGNRMLVTHWNDDVTSPKVSLINTESMSVMDVIIDELPFSHGLSVTSDFLTAYVSPNEGNFFAKYRLKGDLSGFLDAEKFPLEPTDPVPSGTNKYYPYQVLLSPDQSKLFITCRNTNELRIFNTSSYDLTAKIQLDSLPRLMVYDNASDRLFVACVKSKNVAAQGSLRGSVAVVDGISNTLIKYIYNVGHRPHGVGIDPVHNRLYVTSENTGAVDVPHHPIPGANYPPGKFSIVNLNTLEPVLSLQTEVAEFPTSLVISQ
ncbi:MAG: YncE family protein [Bacteroidia bacterium]|nr:YncE family protein [Bacteroidia bacterium]